MVIECKHVWNYISDYLDDTLSPETRDLVQRHLEHCEICSAILDSTAIFSCSPPTTGCLNYRSDSASVCTQGYPKR